MGTMTLVSGSAAAGSSAFFGGRGGGLATSAGESQIAWDGRADGGARLAPGIYFARVRDSGGSTLKLLKLD